MKFGTQLKLGSVSVLAAIGAIYGLLGITGIEPGEVGVIVKNIGDNRGMQEATLNTGLHWLDPFVFDVIVYDTRIRQESMDATPANTQDGQPVSIDISFDVGLLDKGVPNLHERVGPEYYEQIVYPAARAAIRNYAANQTSDAIYTGAGRTIMQTAITDELSGRLQDYGISIEANLRDIEFKNAEFVQTLERKARAQQEVTIQQRQAEAAAQEAIKVQNVAEGERFKVEQQAAGQREKLRLEGEGQRLAEEERAAGILAVATAEAEGVRLRREALSGAGGAELVSIEWARNLGPNVQFYGVPTGAPGTSTYLIDEALRGQIAIGGN